MKCPRPLSLPSGTVPCGQCLPCRVNRQREWTARILIEALSWPSSLFITLTYAPEHVPSVSDGTLTLYPPDLQKFWKRLRSRLGHTRLRYFACGEYGEETMRPHYHAVVFNLGGPLYKRGRYLVHPVVQEAWGMGYTSAGELTPERAAYCAQYVTKKLTRPEDPHVQKHIGRAWPEYAVQSKKPGLGMLEVEALTEAFLHADPAAEDVPQEVVMPDGRRFGMPKLLAAKMRELLGMPALASERPPRETTPPSGEYVELVDVGVAGPITRRVPVEEQRAREREAKALRKRKRPGREKLTHGKEETAAFGEKARAQHQSSGGRREEGGGDAGACKPARVVEGPLEFGEVVLDVAVAQLASAGLGRPSHSDGAEAPSVAAERPEAGRVDSSARGDGGAPARARDTGEDS